MVGTKLGLFGVACALSLTNIDITIATLVETKASTPTGVRETVALTFCWVSEASIMGVDWETEALTTQIDGWETKALTNVVDVAKWPRSVPREGSAVATSLDTYKKEEHPLIQRNLKRDERKV